jgi:anti-sigma B factor antagonist
MSFKLLKNSDEIYLIEAQGDLDLFASIEFKDFFMKAMERKIEKLILNLKAVGSINSAGVGALVNISSTARKMQVEMCLLYVNKEVMETLETSKLTGYFRITDSLEAAVKLLTGQG